MQYANYPQIARFLKSNTASGVTDIATTILGFGSGILVARATGPAGRGIYSTATVAGMLIAYGGSFGFFEAMLAESGVYFEARRRFALLCGAAGSLSMVVIGLTVDSYSSLLTYAPFPLIWGLLQVRMADARLLGDSAWIWLRLVAPSFGLAVFGGLALNGALTPYRALAAVMAGHGLAVLLYDASEGRRSLPESQTVERSLRAVWKAGVRQHLVSFPRLVNMRLDLLLVAGIAPAREVGLYAVAGSVSSLIPTLTWSLPFNLLVLHGRDPSAAVRLKRSLTILAYVATAALTGLSVVFGHVILRTFYGREFEDAAMAFVTLIAAQALWMHTGILESEARARQLTYPTALSEIFGAAILCVITVTLYGRFGIMAPAVGSVFSYGSVLVLVSLALRREGLGAR